MKVINYMKERLFGIFLILCWSSLFITSPQFSKIVGHYFPVIDEVVVTSLEIGADGTEISGYFNKVRDCGFISGEIIVISDVVKVYPIPNEGDTQSRSGQYDFNVTIKGIDYSHLDFTKVTFRHLCTSPWKIKVQTDIKVTMAD